MISLRLKEIANLIPSKVRVIDVGCDHALLDIYLVKKDNTITCLATDIAESSLEKAIFNIKKSNCEDKINTMLTSGLTNIKVTDNDYIVLSGMGTNTIIDIVKSRLKEINNIIIQSNHDLELLREFMFENGFKIKTEKIVYEKRYYVIIHFIKGKARTNYVDIWLGSKIKKCSDLEYFKFLRNKNTKILPGIPVTDRKYKMVLEKINYLDKLIEKKLDHFLESDYLN